MSSATAVPATAVPGTNPTATDEPVARSSRLVRRTLGITSILGGLVTFAGFVTTNWESNPSKAAYLDSLVEAPVQSQIAAVLLHFGYLGLVPVFIALASMVRRRWRVLGHVGVVAGLVAAGSLPGMLVVDFYDLGIRQTLPSDQAVALSDRIQDFPIAAVMQAPTLIGLLLGVVLTGLAAWRNGSLHWVVPLTFVASFVATTQLTGTLGGVLGGVGFLVLMVAVGVRALRTGDAEWSAGTR